MNAIVAVLAIMLPLAAASPSKMPEPEIPADKVVSINKENNKTIIKTEVGKIFTITLPSNITTGYGWRMPVKPDGKIIEFLDSEYIPPEKMRIGAGGHEDWRFKAISPGKTEVKLEYGRPWEKDKPPAREASFCIVVD